MKLFSEWLKHKLNESMNVQVDGIDPHEQIHDFSDLANHLYKKVIEPAWRQLAPETQKRIQQTGVPIYDTITPDGNHYSDGSLTLSVYTGGWDEADVKKILQGIKYYLDGMHVRYQPFKKEQSGMYKSEVYRINIENMPEKGDVPPQLNLSNDNAHLIFRDILDLDQFDTGGSYSIPVRDLIIKIDSAADYKADLHQRDPYTQQEKGKATIHYGGLSADAIRERLTTIRQIAQWAIDHDYDTINVL